MAEYLDYDGLALYDEKIKQVVNAKQDKESGKGLSTNDYTTEEKNKLAGIAAGAEANVQANWTQTTTTADDYIKNKPTLGAAASKGVASSVVSGGADLPTSGAVHTAIQNAIGSVTGISFNTDYTSVSQLPQTGTAGVVYLIPNSGSGKNSYDEYVWTGSAYERLGTTDVDLSGYQPLMSAITNAQINGLFA